MNRRDFLKVTSGATVGGILLPRNENVFPNDGNVQQGRETSTFQMFTDQTSDLEVVAPSGIKVGTILGSQLLTIPHAESVIEDEESISENEAYERLKFSRLIEGIPAQLLPLLIHPINNIQSFESGYELDVIISAKDALGDGFYSEEFVPIPLREGLITPNADIKFWVGDYFIRVSAESGFIGGCISRYVPHAGLLVRYVPGGSGGTQIFNLHVASWWQGSTPCVGIYESASGWCQNLCTWNIWNMLYTLIYAAAIVHVAHWVAVGIAASGATASLGILVAAPGVPPPP